MNESVDDGEIRHLSDGDAWKNFDKEFIEFAVDLRNVFLRLVSDGFNPFGQRVCHIACGKSY